MKNPTKKQTIKNPATQPTLRVLEKMPIFRYQSTTVKLYMNREPTNKSNLEKTPVNLSPFFYSAKHIETVDFMRSASTFGSIENNGCLVNNIHSPSYALGKHLKQHFNNSEFKQYLPKVLPRYRDNTCGVIELSSLALASCQIAKGELRLSKAFTLLISDKTYKAALKSKISTATYLLDRITKQARRHHISVLSVFHHLELQTYYLKQKNESGGLIKGILPHLHGIITFNAQDEGNVRKVLKSINKSKTSSAYANNVEFWKKETFQQAELEFNNQTANSPYELIGWAMYMNKNTNLLHARALNYKNVDESMLPKPHEKLFASTNDLKRMSKECYEELRHGFNAESANDNESIDEFDDMLDRRLSESFDAPPVNVCLGGASHEEATESKTIRFEEIPKIDIDALLLTDDGFNAYMNSPETFVKYATEYRLKNPRETKEPTCSDCCAVLDKELDDLKRNQCNSTNGHTSATP